MKVESIGEFQPVFNNCVRWGFSPNGINERWRVNLSIGVSFSSWLANGHTVGFSPMVISKLQDSYREAISLTEIASMDMSLAHDYRTGIDQTALLKNGKFDFVNRRELQLMINEPDHRGLLAQWYPSVEVLDIRKDCESIDVSFSPWIIRAITRALAQW
jgi:hypothetical protein